MDSRGGFPSTLWSIVLAAGAGREEALETLAGRYLGPIYAFIRRAGRSREDAEDLAQDFFASLLESSAIGKADPRRGRHWFYLFYGGDDALDLAIDEVLLVPRSAVR